jgi:hypothetical protein
MKGSGYSSEPKPANGASKDKKSLFGFGNKNKSKKPHYEGDMKSGKACGKVCRPFSLQLLENSSGFRSAR